MLTIGALARQTGCSAQTIRHYESVGLLPAPVRTEGGQRRYGAPHRDRLGFIRHARELGFGLEAIRDLLSLVDAPDRPCAAVDRIARRHLESVEARIARLEALRAELVRMVGECAGGQVADCRVIEILSDHSHAHCLSEAHGEPAPATRG